jgi:hypothetical protein
VGELRNGERENKIKKQLSDSDFMTLVRLSEAKEAAIGRHVSIVHNRAVR